jgi:NADPH:quinone reductase-like Zn-dependent oxidoreductase
MADQIPQAIPTIVHRVEDHSLHLSSQATPSPSPTQYLIAVDSTTFTNGELFWPEPNSLKDPIPGFDLAGIVLATPTEVATHGITYFQPGTRVYGLTSFSRHGNARGITVAEHKELAQVPDSLELSLAASIPLSALTAWQALFDQAGLQPQEGANTGKRVLVTAASGGVGIWLVQIASWAGAYVVGTCSTSNTAFVKSLGAAEVLDHKTIKLSQWVAEDPDSRPFDIVIDCVGGEASSGSIEEAWTLCKAGGVVNCIAQPPGPKKPSHGVADGVRSFWFIVDPNGKQLEVLGKLVVEGRIKPVVDSVTPLENWDVAWNRVNSGHARGKVVLKIDGTGNE